jgi:uncharacterized protein with PIN domain
MNFVVMALKFIADVHLGKLARLLRMLGFDTVYQNNFAQQELLNISHEEKRILLSRAASITKSSNIEYLVIAEEDPLLQVVQVIRHFNLKDQFNPFSRCFACNGIIEIVSKETIKHLIQKNTATYFSKFWQCQNCKRVYWEGSHFEKIRTTIQRIISLIV